MVIYENSRSGLFARRSGALLVSVGARFNSEYLKIFQPAFDRYRHFADEAGHSLPMAHRKAHQRAKVPNKRIAFVFQVEFEPLGRKYGCTSRWPAIPFCKRQCGVLEQENSADLPVDVTGNPETFLVTADEKCRDRPVDDAGIERLKLRGDGCGLIGRQDVAASAFRRARSSRAPRRRPLRKVRVC